MMQKMDEIMGGTRKMDGDVGKAEPKGTAPQVQ